MGTSNGIRSYRGNRIFRLKNFENNNKQNKNELKHIELQLYNNSKLIFNHQRKPNYYLCVIFNAKYKFLPVFLHRLRRNFYNFVNLVITQRIISYDWPYFELGRKRKCPLIVPF